jgi:hypothetical protein
MRVKREEIETQRLLIKTMEFRARTDRYVSTEEQAAIDVAKDKLISMEMELQSLFDLNNAREDSLRIAKQAVVVEAELATVVKNFAATSKEAGEAARQAGEDMLEMAKNGEASMDDVVKAAKSAGEKAQREALDAAKKAAEEVSRVTITYESAANTMGNAVTRNVDVATQKFGELAQQNVSLINAMLRTGQNVDSLLNSMVLQANAAANLASSIEDLGKVLGHYNDELSRGDLPLKEYIANLEALKLKYNGLGKENLSELNSALKSALETTQSLKDSATSALATALQSFAGISEGNAKYLKEREAEEINWATTRKEILKQIEENDRAGNNQSIVELRRALDLQERIHRDKLKKLSDENSKIMDTTKESFDQASSSVDGFNNSLNQALDTTAKVLPVFRLLESGLRMISRQSSETTGSIKKLASHNAAVNADDILNTVAVAKRGTIQ